MSHFEVELHLILQSLSINGYIIYYRVYTHFFLSVNGIVWEESMMANGLKHLHLN